MSDDTRDEAMELADEDRLPWLEAVEEDEDEGGPSVAKLVAAILIGLVAIGVIVGGLFWLGNRGRPGPNGEVIAAPEGDYKQRPENPGGMNVQGEGDTAFAASAGQTPQGNLNTNAVPERPVARPPVAPPAPPAPAPTARPAPPPVAIPPPPPSRPAAPVATAVRGGGGGATIQLGAFSSPAGANSAWSAMSARFRYLAPLGHSVAPVRVGARTLYRLRASGPDAAGVCRRLQIAGEDCSVVS